MSHKNMESGIGFSISLNFVPYSFKGLTNFSVGQSWGWKKLTIT